MIIEYAQLLSTAHRVLDGAETEILWNGRRKKIWVLPDDPPFYVATHVNHPCAIWVRQSRENYRFLCRLWIFLCAEYEHRYGRFHATFARLQRDLPYPPKNIPEGEFTEPPACMPDEYKVDDVVTSYQNLYVGDKVRFARWTNRTPPEWFSARVKDYNESDFTRTRKVA